MAARAREKLTSDRSLLVRNLSFANYIYYNLLTDLASSPGVLDWESGSTRHSIFTNKAVDFYNNSSIIKLESRNLKQCEFQCPRDAKIGK